MSNQSNVIELQKMPSDVPEEERLPWSPQQQESTTLKSKMSKVIARLFQQFLDRASTFSWFFIFNLPYVVSVALTKPFTWLTVLYTVVALFRILFHSSVTTALIILARKRPLQIILQAVLYMLTIYLFVVDIIMIVSYQQLANPALVTLLFLSNVRETVEFLGTFFSNIIIHMAIGLAIVVLFLLHAIFAKIFSNKTVLKVILVAGSLSLLVPLTKYPFANSVVRIISVHVSAFYELKMIHDLAVNATPEHILDVEGMAKIPKAILIIGESTSRNHMSLYGYNLATTPKLEKLMHDGNLSVFTDVISAHANTEDVMKDLLTFHNSQSDKPWYNYTNVINVINSAGYHTTWISNQDTGGLVGSVPRILSAVTNQRIDATATAAKDIQDSLVLPHYYETLKNDKPYNFIFLHLMGTHNKYRCRYPTEYARFSEHDVTGLTQQQRQGRAQYANAILYNDYIVNEIISQVKDEEAVVIYLSDHAEEVYDDPYHNYAGHDEFAANHWMVEIPFMIYTSPSFVKSHPDLTERIRTSVNRPYATDDFVHTLLDILDLHTAGYDPTRSVINPSFNTHRPRLYTNKLYPGAH